MSVENDSQDYDEMFDEEVVYVTEKVKCYEKGKVFSCDCGQDFGTFFEESQWRCPTCGKVLIDEKWNERGPPEREEGQSSLTDFM